MSSVLDMRFQRYEYASVMVGFIGRREAGEFQKEFVPPYNIVDGGGRRIPRCWRSRQGHGGLQSKLLAWVGAGRGPTDSSIESVPV